MNYFPTWTKKNIDRAIRDPLGIYSLHRGITDLLFSGINTQTDIPQYYPFLCWCVQNDLMSEENTLEKLIGISCFAHHNAGENKWDEGRPRGIKGSNLAAKYWDASSDTQSLDYYLNPNSSAKNYYFSQLSRLGLMNGRGELTTAGMKLAKLFEEKVKGFNFFYDIPNKISSEELLKAGQHICFCKFLEYPKEISSLQAVLFGIVHGEYNEEEVLSLDIDEKAIEDILKGKKSFNDFSLEQTKTFGLVTQLRREALLYLLYILHFGLSEDARDDIRSALLYEKIAHNGKPVRLNLKNFKKIRKYLKFYSGVIFYTLASETLFYSLLQKIKEKTIEGVRTEELIEYFVEEGMYQKFSEILKLKKGSITKDTTLKELIGHISRIYNITDKNLSDISINFNESCDGSSKINEDKLAEVCLESEGIKDTFAHGVLLLIYLFLRFQNEVKSTENWRELFSADNEFLRQITSIQTDYKNNITLKGFLARLIQDKIEQHNTNALNKFTNSNERSWWFLEENGKLYFEKDSNVYFMDGFLENVLSFLAYLNLVDKNRKTLTKEGKRWASLVH